MELFLISAFFIGLYIYLTFVSIWCLSVMFFLAFDHAWLKHYETRQYIERMNKHKLRFIKGGKDDSDNSVRNDSTNQPI